jgi:hypothetical protein
MLDDQNLYCNFFIGNYSPFLLFEYEFHSLDEIANAYEHKETIKKNNAALEICTIGIVSHFEAFCKHTFAAIINICPALLNNFSAKRPDISFLLKDILTIREEFQKSLNFLVTEKQDFGSAKKINSLFIDLAKISPFSNDDSFRFDYIMKKRNLIVHHGSVFTFNYIQSSNKKNEIEKVFKDKLPIQLKDYIDDADFLFDIAIKLTKSSAMFLSNLLDEKNENYNDKKRAIELLTRAIYDDLI